MTVNDSMNPSNSIKYCYDKLVEPDSKDFDFENKVPGTQYTGKNGNLFFNHIFLIEYVTCENTALATQTLQRGHFKSYRNIC